MLPGRSFRKYFLFFTAVVLLAYPAVGQNSPLARAISISFSNLSLAQALQQIEISSGQRFSYNSDILPADARVSIVAKNKSMEKVLSSMLGQDYYFKSSGKYIIILQKIKAGQSSATEQSFRISGRIVDAKTNLAVPLATVYDMASMASAVSDKQGSFSFWITPRTTYIGLRCCRAEYLDTVAFVNPSQQTSIVFRILPKEATITRLNKITPQVILHTDSIEFSLAKRILSDDMLLNSSNVIIPDKRIAQFSFFPGYGTNQLLGGAVVNHISINLLGGFSKGVSGFEVGGLFNINKLNMDGAQFSGLVNMTGKNVRGLQVAGLMNLSGGNFHGVQGSGLCNLGADTVHGLQLAGLYNECKSSLHGLQVAGGVNMSKAKDGGSQIAGLLNYSPHPRFQLGLINVADTSDGMPLGAINIIKHGYYSFSMHVDETQTGHLLFSMGTSKLHSILGLSNRPNQDNHDWGICFGLGTHLMQQSRLSLTVEMLNSIINTFGSFDSTTVSRCNITAALSLRLGKRVYFSAGPSVNCFIASSTDESVDAFIKDAIPGDSWHYASSRTRFDGWLGYNLGLRIKI